MSVAQNPLTGHMRKSMANFVTSSYNGINTIRAKVFRRKDNKTKAQMDHRAGFTLVAKAFGTLGVIADWGFAERKSSTSAYNMFISANYPSAVDKTGEVPVIVYPQLLVSKGSIPRVRITGSTVEAQGITISYETGMGLPKVSASDEIIAFAKLTDNCLLISRMPRGNEESESIVIPIADDTDETVECCYVFARSADGKKVSNSVYVELND